LPGNIGGRNLSRQSGTASYASRPWRPRPRRHAAQLLWSAAPAVNFAAYGLITGGPKAGYDLRRRHVRPIRWPGRQLHKNGDGRLIERHQQQAASARRPMPGDQINTHEFTQGLINPLTRGSVLWPRVL
jgi:hypothetical protein